MSIHVPVDRALQVEPGFRYVDDYLHAADPELRLRKSVDHPGFYVLERRCRRTRPIQTTRRDLTDRHIQARDGYVHVSTVHRRYLDYPLQIVAALHEDGVDLHRAGGYARVDADLRRQDDEARQRRREKRRAHFEDIAADAFRIQDRVGGEGGTERVRLNNAGIRPWSSTDSSAGESPATGESTDEHTPRATHARENRRLHHSPAV